jgi:metal-dependent hydrolase (beta-lactamase superfamily II)
MLFDGGYKDYLIPNLKRLKVTNVGYAILTHYHQDHFSGLQELIKQ